MNLKKDVYTTFEAAKICNANITSIKNWIEQGELRAFRTPGGHFRIERQVLDDFLSRHRMPNPFAQQRQRRVLVVHSDAGLEARVRARFGDEIDYDVSGDAVDALLKIGQWQPDVAVLDSELQGLDVLALCKRVREHEELQGMMMVVICGDDAVEAMNFRGAGARWVVARSEGEDAVMEALRRALL
ncbi:helix-turn-helix domain-containing protein [Bradymonadaceae bacterium TMQ3]|uniref:Helix-turn-helix domain-containing protein n=1 Tax=Lujinxingia sediminis TaxID=2480984 RepID=A0ABY0CT13_9DELT|nr:helix-turn-helix domain-containing protein [Lujinxingia sediminis]RDV38296.1 helix-turn-helix domain-containing protein [Bradymonadaceae bacterium TMQ3]RVU43501.1 helix-turn-helix domain-containing protein [Lujinxingia sediminis]TXC75970.1 helix-turn-helix domain-containing protein [Bradymonadales bacterium TMQ1]